MGETCERGIDDEVHALGPWFHNLHLPNGIQTAPQHELGDFPAFKWREIKASLPTDLSGWTALDVGCNAGFYSFELAKCGAQVTGIDLEPHYLAQARWAAKHMGLERRVEFREESVYDLSRSTSHYDLVLFMGVFYHLRYPLLALDGLAAKVRRLLVFQTLTMPGEDVLDPPEDMPLLEREAMLEAGWPRMAFIEKRLANDLTNWWAPNHAAVLALLRSSGLTVLERPGHEIYLCAPMEGRAPLERELIVKELYTALGAQPTARP